MLIQKIDEDRHCGTCVAERCRTIPAASETVHDAELLTFDDSSEAWLPTPASTNQGSPSSPSSATFAIDSTSALHSGRGHVYQRATSAGDSLQINGDVVGTLPNVRQLNNHYVDMAASEKSKQFNGNLDLEVILELLKIQG
jgi:hypothetical protein